MTTETIAAPKTAAAKIYDWVDERLGLSELAAFARHKTVPVHSQSFWYYWGGISLFLFLVQCFTGVLLLVYYRPGVEAFESVRQITFVMHFGWLIRSAHAWSANLMIFAILVHMFSVYFMKAYRKPRELGWLSGMALLGIASVFGFSGYLLPMDELSYFATKVGLEIPAAIPSIGPAIANMLRGGPEVSEFTVQRFFALHVVVLPALFLPLLGFHLWLVQRHGNAVPPSEEAKPTTERKNMPFMPNFLRKDLAMWLISLNVLALLASVFPWALGKQFDLNSTTPVPAPAGIHPEWYFMSPFEMLKLLGNVLPGESGEIAGILLFSLGIALWVLIPFYDIKKESGQRARAAHYFGLLAVFALLATTVIGYWTIR
ncbi:MAG: cytochrome b N-terminal domain-containing protein [Terracidiphilus sp.]|jgi:quinol-cytochrome oxidoreductase complex cytochrome b subunit